VAEKMKITVRELIEDLSGMNPNDEVVFGSSSGLTYYRTKDRSGHVQIEFEESVYRTEEGELIVEDHRSKN